MTIAIIALILSIAAVAAVAALYRKVKTMGDNQLAINDAINRTGVSLNDIAAGTADLRDKLAAALAAQGGGTGGDTNDADLAPLAEKAEGLATLAKSMADDFASATGGAPTGTDPTTDQPASA